MSEADDRELLLRLRALRKRIPRFSGVIWDGNRRKYRASIKRGPKVRVLGWFDTEAEAFRAYCAANAALHPRGISPYESKARIEKMLRLASACPLPVRPDEIIRSTLNVRLWENG